MLNGKIIRCVSQKDIRYTTYIQKLMAMDDVRGHSHINFSHARRQNDAMGWGVKNLDV